MNKLNIDEININNASIKILTRSNNIILKIDGHIEFRNPEETLDPFFENLHNKLLKNNIKKIICNIKDLSFINSSSIKSLITWIMKLNDIDDSKKYKIIFIHNKNVSWQKTSLKNLCFLVPNFVEIK